MDILTNIVIAFLLFATLFCFVAWRVNRGRLNRLEYVCLTNSKKLDFYRNYHGELYIEVTPRSGEKWKGDVEKVYRAFASPTGWEARDSITAGREVSAVAPDDEYQPGSWKDLEVKDDDNKD